MIFELPNFLSILTISNLKCMNLLSLTSHPQGQLQDGFLNCNMIIHNDKEFLYCKRDKHTLNYKSTGALVKWLKMPSYSYEALGSDSDCSQYYGAKFQQKVSGTASSMCKPVLQ